MLMEGTSSALEDSIGKTTIRCHLQSTCEEKQGRMWDK